MAGRLAFPLLTPRVALRPFIARDSRAMASIYADPRVMRWVGHGPVLNRRGTAALLHGYTVHQKEHGFSCWAVIERATERMIGDAGLFTRGTHVELGYTLGHEHWNRGYASEAAGRCVEAAFGPLGLAELTALVRPENTASVSVLTKLGFGRVTDVDVYGAPHARYTLAGPR